MKNIKIIGIAGGSGSGKTRLVKNILSEVDENKITSIEIDSYYKDLKKISFEERCKNNFDHPNSIDFELLHKDLEKILDNQSTKTPVYDYKTHTRKDEFKKISTQKIILIEGILTFYDKRVRDILDMKIFVDTDEKARIERRIKRDIRSRKRTYESIMHQFQSTVIPMHNKFIQPTKKYADFIITRGVKNTVAMEKVISNIISMVNTKN